MDTKDLRVRFQLEHFPVTTGVCALDHAKQHARLITFSLDICGSFVDTDCVHILFVSALQYIDPADFLERVEMDCCIQHLPRAKSRRLAPISHRQPH